MVEESSQLPGTRRRAILGNWSDGCTGHKCAASGGSRCGDSNQDGLKECVFDQLPINAARRLKLSLNVAIDALGKIESIHRDIEKKQIRELDILAKKIACEHDCPGCDLKGMVARFERFHDVLMPWLIREQFLVLPTLREKLQVELAGLEYHEAYSGEFDDLARVAGVDHHRLELLVESLERDVEFLSERERCPLSVRRFVEMFRVLAEFLRMQVQVERIILRP